MPILRGGVTYSRFLAKAPHKDKQWLTKGLHQRAFEPLDPSSDTEKSAGFVELEDREASEFAAGNLFYGEYALFSWRVDKLKIPGSVVRAELEKFKKAYEKDNGRPPKRGEVKERKAAIEGLLRSRTPPNSKSFDVSWNLKTGQLQIWATSRTIIDDVIDAMERSFDVKPEALTAAQVADSMGLAEDSLRPTPELNVIDGEVAHES